jgi:aldehyde dehydrogenase (NAD+)
MDQSQVLVSLGQMQNYFVSGATRNIEWRKQQLHKLKDALYKHEEAIYEALDKDLKKNKEEVMNYC